MFRHGSDIPTTTLLRAAVEAARAEMREADAKQRSAREVAKDGAFRSPDWSVRSSSSVTGLCTGAGEVYTRRESVGRSRDGPPFLSVAIGAWQIAQVKAKRYGPSSEPSMRVSTCHQQREAYAVAGRQHSDVVMD